MMMQIRKRHFVLLPLLLVLVAGAGGSYPGEVIADDRPGAWATQMGEMPGMSNFYKVSDDLYRGAQPDEEGFAQLKKAGVKTLVNLRTFHSDREESQAAGLQYFHITVQAWEGEDEEVADFLKIVLDPANHPVFVHCKHGADRTGVMVAVYRLVVQGWSKEEAIREMTEGGYGFHSVWQNLIEYVEDLDVERVKELSGMNNAMSSIQRR